MKARNLSREHTLIILFVVAPRDVDDYVPRFLEQPFAIGVGGKHRAIAGQRQAERLSQTVHRIGREHSRARPAGWASRSLDGLNLLVAERIVGGDNHGVNEVDSDFLAFQHHLAGLHWTARNKDGGNIEAKCCHQHAGRDLVAIRDTDHGVGTVCVDHIFDAVCNQLARRQAVEHTLVSHGDAIIDRDGVELLGHATRSFDFAGNELAQILEMDMTRHELGERVDDGNDWLAEIGVRHSGGAPKPAGAGHVAAVRGGPGTVSRHDRVLGLSSVSFAWIGA